MAKSMNIKNNGSKTPLVKTQKASPMVTAYRQSPLPTAGPKGSSPFNLVRNNVNPSDSHRLQAAIKVPGRVKGGSKPGFFK
jgi:hypothetical protein